MKNGYRHGGFRMCWSEWHDFAARDMDGHDELPPDERLAAHEADL